MLIAVFLIFFVIWFLFTWGFSYHMGIIPAMGLALVAVPVALGVLVFWTAGGILGAFVFKRDQRRKKKASK